MKIEHLTDNPVYIWSWSFETKIDNLHRYYTYVDLYDDTFQITDRWTGKEYPKEKFNQENEIYLKIEEIAKFQNENELRNEIVNFYNKKTPLFNNEIKDHLFDAWLYNTDIFNLVSETINVTSNSFENNRQTSLTFSETPKYYYERPSNKIVLLENCQVITHKHFWINIDYHNSTIEKVILKYFGNEIYEIVKNEHFYFDRKCYDVLLKNINKNDLDLLLKFKRTVSENWLTYTNKHFLIPISFANRNNYI